MHASHSIALSASGIVAALGLAIAGALTPAVAATETPPSPAEAVLSPPAAQAAAAVLDYVSTRTRPVPPEVGASLDERNAFAAEELAYFEQFPFEAGLAQWGCESVAPAEVGLIPADGGRPATVVRSFTADCGDGYRPNMAEVTTPRSAQAGTVGDDRSPWSPEEVDATSCAVIADGHHCLGFAPSEVRMRYTWLGTGSIDGRIRFGHSDWFTAPACNLGYALLSPRTTFTPGSYKEISRVRDGSAHLHVAFLETGPTGREIERSSHCAFG